MNKFLVLSLLLCSVVTAMARRPDTEIFVVGCNNPVIGKKYDLTDIIDWGKIAKETKLKEFRLNTEYFGTIVHNCSSLVCDIPVPGNPKNPNTEVLVLGCNNDVIEKTYDLADIIGWGKIAKETKLKKFRLNMPHFGTNSYNCPITKS